MHLFSSTSAIWTSMGFTLAISPPSLSVASFVLRVMVTVHWIGSGRRRKLSSSSSEFQTPSSGLLKESIEEDGSTNSNLERMSRT
ncbi:unnamed protein product [Linum tenue]|uniref:Secreted protein n=1 Tax=Linum tenue TaxID=586396 RepID=A0AAV0P995_9ROSI|nr:unnamed protein product [Linum tenue]